MEIFLAGLLVTSIFTGLVTEGVKKILNEHNVAYRPNTLAGVVAMVLSLGISVGYTVVMGVPFTASLVVFVVALIALSWLCAMVGYDKVVQTLGQIGIIKKG